LCYVLKKTGIQITEAGFQILKLKMLAIKNFKLIEIGIAEKTDSREIISKLMSLLLNIFLRKFPKIDKIFQILIKMWMTHFLRMKMISLSKIFSISKNTNNWRLQIKILIWKNNHPSEWDEKNVIITQNLIKIAY